MFIRELDITEDSVIIDFGGGEGYMVANIAKKVGLKTPPLVIDPSPGMVKGAEKRSEIKSMCSYAEEILSGEKKLP